MSGRAYRKLIQKRAAEEHPTDGDITSGSTDDEDTSQTSYVNPFDLLEGEEAASDEPDADVDVAELEEPVKKRDSEDLGNEEDGEVGEERVSEPPVTTSKRKKNKSKGKRKGKAAQSVSKPEMSVEEFERALRDANEKFAKETHSASGPDTAVDSTLSSGSNIKKLLHLLSVDGRMLDADSEMRRMFGSSIMNEEIRMKKYKRSTVKKTALATARENWPRMEKLGLDMELLESYEGEFLFSFKHSIMYDSVQKLFLDVVESHDPNMILRVVQQYPYHIDALLQLSEIYKYQGNHNGAGELIERALYAFEKSFHSMFNIALGSCRVDYLRHENRSFFLAIHRHVQNLGRRGCWRTAFEYAKLLLALEPEEDPLGVLQAIDFYALKSREYVWFDELCSIWWTSRELFRLPNFMFSIALNKFHMEVEGSDGSSSGSTSTFMPESSSVLLQRAILQFPYLLTALCEKCGVALDSEISSNPYFAIDDGKLWEDGTRNLQLFLSLYVERCSSLWKEPEVIAWLLRNAKIAHERSSAPDDVEVAGLTIIREESFTSIPPLNICRHVIISDYQSLLPLLPKEIDKLSRNSFDPLPPPDETDGPFAPDASTNDNSPFDALASFFRRLTSNEPTTAADQDAPDAAAGGPHIDAMTDEQIIATARELPPGLFPPPTEDNTRPEWLTSLRDTAARLLPLGLGRAFGATPPPTTSSAGAESTEQRLEDSAPSTSHSQSTVEGTENPSPSSVLNIFGIVDVDQVPAENGEERDAVLIALMEKLSPFGQVEEVSLPDVANGIEYVRVEYEREDQARAAMEGIQAAGLGFAFFAETESEAAAENN